MDDDPFLSYINQNITDNKIAHLEKKIIELYETQQKIINKFNKFVESYNILADLNEQAVADIVTLKGEVKNLQEEVKNLREEKKSHKKRKIN